MKTAIIYSSEEQGNTKDILDAMTAKHAIDLYDAEDNIDLNLEAYELIGFVVDVRRQNIKKEILKLEKRCLPFYKKVFIIYIAGSPNNHYVRPIIERAKEKNCAILGVYHHMGDYKLDPFSFFRKGRKGKTERESIQRAVTFYESLFV